MRLRKRLAALVAALFGPSGIQRDELLMLIGLALVATGAWQVWRPGAFLAPGLVLLWLALPARAPFVLRPPESQVVKPPTRRRAS